MCVVVDVDVCDGRAKDIASSISRTVAYRLVLFIFFLKLPLHVEVGLSLSLDPLLFHVSNHASMHCLESRAPISTTELSK